MRYTFLNFCEPFFGVVYVKLVKFVNTVAILGECLEERMREIMNKWTGYVKEVVGHFL